MLMGPVKTDREKSQQKTHQLLVWSGVVDFALGMGKVLVGIYANSHALIADGIHSFSDLGTDIMVWFFNRIGVEEPDLEHPYGHARFETFGTFILGVMLLGVAGLLIWDSVDRLLDIESVSLPTWPALMAALVSIVTKELLYFITRKQGEKTHSSLLIANAWHHRSDALSSVIVLIGVGGALLGYAWLEMFAAIGIAFMIALIGWRLSRKSVEELVDTALSETYVNQIRKQIESAEGVLGVHHIRTRRMGQSVFLDIHLQVDSAISVSEGHHIGEWVTRLLMDEFHDITDITVHVDAEDDADMEEHEQTNMMAPLRQDVRHQLQESWRHIISNEDINKINLHYLNQGIDVELFIEHSAIENQAGLQDQLNMAAENLPWFNQVTVWFHPG